MPILNKFVQLISHSHVAAAFDKWRNAVAQEAEVERYAAASGQERGVAVLLRHLKHCRRHRFKMRQVYIPPHPTPNTSETILTLAPTRTA